MALFADGPASTIDDLTNQDSGFLDVAQTCGINATTKLRLAHDELETDLEIWLNRVTPVLPIEQVVVTPTLKRWETLVALSMFYRDAYFSQLVDRYQARWDEYSKLSRQAYEKFVATGLGLVANPIRQAAIAVLGSVAGPQAGGTFYASVAWVNAAGQEGAASIAASATIAVNHLMTVAVVNMPANAVGFNVYAGPSISSQVAQNDVPLAPATIFTYVPGFRTQGRSPGRGQQPDYVRPLTRTL